MPWATTSHVTTYTGLNATAAQVEQAQAIVEIFADTTEDASDAGNISSKNLRLLKLAVAYEAAWITQHPDVFTNIDLTQVQQDGVVATMQHNNALVLAPMAKRCIDRLSWRRTRSQRIGPMAGSRGGVPRRMNATNAVADDNDPRWQPLDTGGGC
ncbi:hypothetical protein [Streptomyces liliifuscus]|uniref:Uncharacterized protein n=1 Tax=Streptomyces liliifuscus TaxID=2797636 RepID=A0A7T7L2E2_9ACTN|nr:hypothetical protein [Streptomyces liliifuscus]QQM45197.1 hypothetical protein JEQ17_41200 [Streptomyces liliifuscus]